METSDFRRKIKVLNVYGRLRRGTLGLSIITGVGLWMYAIYTFLFIAD